MGVQFLSFVDDANEPGASSPSTVKTKRKAEVAAKLAMANVSPAHAGVFKPSDVDERPLEAASSIDAPAPGDGDAAASAPPPPPPPPAVNARAVAADLPLPLLLQLLLDALDEEEEEVSAEEQSMQQHTRLPCRRSSTRRNARRCSPRRRSDGTTTRRSASISRRRSPQRALPDVLAERVRERLAHEEAPLSVARWSAAGARVAGAEQLALALELPADACAAAASKADAIVSSPRVAGGCERA